jgi:hypothetical protein
VRADGLDRAGHERHRSRGEVSDDRPVEPGGGVDREHGDGHRVVPGQLVVPDEQPGDGDGQRGLDGGHPRHRAGQAPEHQRGQSQERDADQGRRHRRKLVPELGRDQLVKGVGTDLALAAGQRMEDGPADPQVRGHQREAHPGRGGGQRPPRPAQRPGQREPEQQVGQHEVGRDPDEQARGQGAGHPARGILGPQQDQAEERRGGRQHVKVPARQQRPEQQGIHRPEQMRPGAAGRVRAQQPVEADGHAEEGEPVPHLQPEDDPGRGGAAELRGRPLLGGGQRAVQRRVPVPGEMRQAAERIAGAVQLRRGHHVGVVTEHGHPPVGGVADRVGGAGRRQDGQSHDGDRRQRDQQPGGIPRSARDRDQPGGDTAAAEDRGRPQAKRHQLVRQVQRKFDRQRAGRPGHHRNRQAVPCRRDDDHDDDRAADAGRGEPAEGYQPGRRPRWLSMASPDCGHLSVRYPAGSAPNLARTGRPGPYAASVYDPWCEP